MLIGIWGATRHIHGGGVWGLTASDQSSKSYRRTTLYCVDRIYRALMQHSCT